MTCCVGGLKKISDINYFRDMEDPSSPTRLVFNVLSTLSTVARDSGFCDPFVTLVTEDRAPPAYITHLLRLSRYCTALIAHVRVL